MTIDLTRSGRVDEMGGISTGEGSDSNGKSPPTHVPLDLVSCFSPSIGLSLGVKLPLRIVQPVL
jgi:hypothetical protein